MNSVATKQTSELAQFDQLATDIKLHVEPCMKIKVSNNDTQVVAYDAAKTIKQYQKMVEERRVELKAPYLEKCKQIDAAAKKLSEPLCAVEKHIKTELTNHERELQKIRDAEMKKAQEELRKKEAELAAAAKAKQEEAEMASMFMAPEDAAEVKVLAEVEKERITGELQAEHAATITTIGANRVSGASRPWVFEVTDAAKVPREFLIVDEKAIRAAVREGIREIPGVNIYQDVRVSIR